jgi:hypothetical protein
MACSNAKTGAANGSCRPVSAGANPDGDCSVDVSNSCGSDGTCSGLGTTSSSCRLRASGTTCGTQTCGGTPPAVDAFHCDGNGACAHIPQPCNGFPCSGSSCASSCTSGTSDGCSPGFRCRSGNTCEPKMAECGNVTCSAGSMAQCCATGSETAAVFTCQGPGETCDQPTGHSLMECKSSADCPSGQICCAGGGSCDGGNWGLLCTADIANCKNGYGGFGYRAATGVGAECPINTTFISFSYCIPGVFICRPN